jgi:hypothetical protein
MITSGGELSATGNDGTTSKGKTREGACANHGGVKTWDKE